MYVGYLSKDANGVLAVRTYPIGQVAVPHFSDVFFVAAADDQQLVQQALDAVITMDQMFNHQIQLPAQVIPNGLEKYYVYAYFLNPNIPNIPNIPNWTDCFYIGKGKADRLTSHIKNRCGPIVPPAGSEKDRYIDEWIAAQRNAAAGQLNGQFLINQAKQQAFVRELGQWSGPHAEACAFASEHFLIRGCVGVYQLGNSTGGNNRIGGLRVLARDAGLSMTAAAHSAAWTNAVSTFMVNPGAVILDSRVRPLLHLLSYQALLAQLDHNMAQIGLVPQARNYFDPNEYPGIPAHFSVEGASDPCLTYVTQDHRPFRIQLKLSRSKDGAFVNVRPRNDGIQGRQEFQRYFQQADVHGVPLANFYGGSVPIRSGPGAPYFKPFSRDGDGNVDSLFSINSMLNPVTGYANWMQGGDFTLSLYAVLQRFLAAF